MNLRLVVVLCALAPLAAPLRAAAPLGRPDLDALLKKAPKLETEDLCEPVRSIREGMLLRAPNPDTNTWDLIQIYFPRYGGPNTIVIIDPGSGRVKQVQTERGWNFHLCPSVVAPNGKLFISILDGRLRQKICLYDPATNELKIDAVKMPEDLLGETHPLVLGTDGKLYAIGQHPSKAAAAAQIDPDTLAVTFYGPIGPSHAPSACWGYSGAADGRYVYVASGKVPWHLVAYDRKTGKSETLATTGTVGGMVSVGQGRDGCTAKVSGIVGPSGERQEYWLHEGKAIPVSDRNVPPWPVREPGPPPTPGVEVNTSRAVPDLEGFAEIWVRPAQPGRPRNEPADAAPEQLGWKRFRFQVPLHPHSIYRLVEMPDGRLLGTAGSYEGNFVFDPKTAQGKHLGKIGLSHYATAFSGPKVYMSGYPSSPLYAYDPAQPWTAGTVAGHRVIEDGDGRANPRRLLYMGAKELAGTHKMYAAVTAAGGKVFFGGQWVRDGSCGGLAWYDPATGQAGGLWKPLSALQVTHMAAADEGRLIVVSTRRVEDTVLKKPKPEQGALLVFEVAKGDFVHKLEPVKLAKGTGPIVCPGGSRIVGWAPNGDNADESVLYLADAREGKLLATRTLGYPLPVAIGSNQQENWDFRLGPDGKVWTFLNNVLIAIDPATLDIAPIGRLDKPGCLALAAGRIYLGGTTAVRRVK
ncbi:MAG: hypothetical protein BWX88_03885 [Planctomycetes bacterium ADurb.Bin126]|nr:MAG: hypothetical protein BWX88_03885 [Planctomycetes bacterium ADurb.Bin126]